jgi:hypothetical protein
MLCPSAPGGGYSQFDAGKERETQKMRHTSDNRCATKLMICGRMTGSRSHQRDAFSDKIFYIIFGKTRG